MGPTEAAAIITKAAIENHLIDFDNSFYRNNHDKAEEANKHNAKQVAEFFQTIYTAIDKR